LIVGDCDSGRRRLSDEFEMVVTAAGEEVFYIEPNEWINLMEYYLEGQAVVVDVTPVTCTSCDSLLSSIVWESQETIGDDTLLSINITIDATSTAIEGWKIDPNNADLILLSSNDVAIIGYRLEDISD